jgi:hypothetical protein
MENVLFLQVAAKIKENIEWGHAKNDPHRSPAGAFFTFAHSTHATHLFLREYGHIIIYFNAGRFKHHKKSLYRNVARKFADS